MSRQAYYRRIEVARSLQSNRVGGDDYSEHNDEPLLAIAASSVNVNLARSPIEHIHHILCTRARIGLELY